MSTVTIQCVELDDDNVSHVHPGVAFTLTEIEALLLTASQFATQQAQPRQRVRRRG